MAICTTRIDIHVNYSKSYKECEASYDRQIAAWARNFSRGTGGDMVGKTIRFLVADGHAEYMVSDQEPLTLVHVNAFDGYEAHPLLIHNLNEDDVRAMIELDNRVITATINS